MKPMNFKQSILYFFIPAVVFAVFFYLVTPLLEKIGMNEYYAYLIALIFPLLLLGLTGIFLIKKEDETLDFKGILQRLNFNKISKSDILTLIIVFAVEMLIFFFAVILNDYLLENNLYFFFESLPRFADPRLVDSLTAIEEAVGSIKGNILLLLISFVVLIVNVFGEEVYWRGYVLERQKLAFGKNIWWIHGLLWASFHAFRYFDIIVILPVALSLSYLVYRSKNNTLGIIFHFLVSSTTFLVILYNVIAG
jgi:membrane protease YdiL (CAAX protease family)